MKVFYLLVAAVCLVACICAAPVVQDAKAKEAQPVSQQQQQKPNEDAKSKATVSVSQFKQQKNLEQQLSSLSETVNSKDVAKPVTELEQMPADDTAVLDEQNEQLLNEIASLRPRAVAVYLLTTGNWEVFEDVLTDLVNSQLVTEEEAQVFYDDVNFEYEQAMLQVMEAEGDNEADVQEAEVVPEQQAEEEYYSDASDSMTSPVDSDSDSSSVDEEELNELLAHLMNEQQQEEEEETSEDVEQQQPEEELEAVAAEAAGEQTAESELEELTKTEPEVKVAAPQQSKSPSQEKSSQSQGQKSASN